MEKQSKEINKGSILMNERTNKIMCEEVNDFSNWRKNEWVEIPMKELRDEGWTDKWINEWSIVLVKDEWKSKQMDEWIKEIARKMGERINDWKIGQMSDKWREYERYFTTFWI